MINKTLAYGPDVAGYSSLMVAILFLGGLQLMVLGIFGEYLGRSYTEAKRRSLYVTRDHIGFDRDTGRTDRIFDRTREIAEDVSRR